MKFSQNSRIYVAGHLGLVGSAIHRELHKAGYNNVIVKARRELDLLDSIAVQRFYKSERLEYVFVACETYRGLLVN